MKLIRTPKELQALSRDWKKSGEVALVTTMGALHEGHLALVKNAKAMAPRCIVTIFVNPLQFAPHEDFDSYPRRLQNDLELLAPLNVDAIFTPEISDFYPVGFNTKVEVSGLTNYLCGKSRPHFFGGVAMVCLKLFQSSLADIAIYGEKDFQQLRVLEKMVEDLNLPLKIVGHPTVRESDGLALSSRNRYLSELERGWAKVIPEILFSLRDRARANSALTVSELLGKGREILVRTPMVLDYLEIASELDLAPANPSLRLREMKSPHLFIAAKAGNTRLIDNIALWEKA